MKDVKWHVHIWITAHHFHVAFNVLIFASSFYKAAQWDNIESASVQMNTNI
jgi:hypothetical protein